MAEEMACACDKYQANVEYLGAVLVAAYIHGVNYNGAAFVYCPWCGEKLRDGEIELSVVDAPQVGATQ